MSNSLLDPRCHVVLVTDAQKIPSFYVRFLDPIELVTKNYNVIPQYFEGAEAVAQAADLLIVQRNIETPTRRIVEAAKKRGIPIIYETDDNLLDLPRSSSMRLSNELADNIEAALTMADLVLCSTPQLAKAMAQYNERVEVIDNYGLDKPPIDVLVGRPHLAIVNTDYFKLSESKGSFFTALYRAVEDLNYRITFFGSVDSEMTAMQGRYPDAVSIVDSFIDDRSAFLDRLAAHGVNVAAVPLDDTDQHAIKSDIKYLDFASLGVPGIFNNTRVYASVRHEVDGYIVDNSQGGWFEGLRYFSDAEHRRACGEAAREVVRNNRGIEHYAKRLGEVYAQTLAEVSSRPLPAPVDRNRSGMFWQSGNLFLLHDGSKSHVHTKPVIAKLIEAGFGFIDPRAEEFALGPAPEGLVSGGAGAWASAAQTHIFGCADCACVRSCAQNLVDRA